MRAGLYLFDLLICIVLGALMAAIVLTPMPLGLRLGRALGMTYYHLRRKSRRETHRNLMLAFGDSLSPAARERLARRVFRHFGQAAFEMVYAGMFLGPRTFRRHVRVHNEEAAAKMLAAGHGMICVTAHLGNWEVVGTAAGLFGFPLHSLYRPVGGPLLDWLTHVLRERHGQRLVPVAGSMARLTELVRQGKCIGLLADQYARRRDIFVKFFGLPSATTGLVALLAQKTGAPILAGYAVRRGEGFSYDLFLEPLPVEKTGNRRADLVQLTQAYMASVEKFARRYPEQYLWMHRRWRIRDLHAAGIEAPWHDPKRERETAT